MGYMSLDGLGCTSQPPSRMSVCLDEATVSTTCHMWCRFDRGAARIPVPFESRCRSGHCDPRQQGGVGKVASHP